MERESGRVLAPSFRSKLPFNPVKCLFSPCANYFATFGQSETMVIIWYRRSERLKLGNHGKYDYLLLPHQDCILNIEWRHIMADKYSLTKQRHNTNVLLTTCADRITRLWVEKSQGYGFSSFDLAAVIEPSKYHSTLNSVDSIGSFVNWLTLPNTFDFDSEITTAKHPTRSRLYESLKEYPDMLFQVKDDGSIIIWGIQGLGKLPPRVTKVVMLMKTDHAIDVHDFEYFDCAISTVFIEPIIPFSNYTEVILVAHSRKNLVLNAYAMNLEDFFSRTWTSPRLETQFTWCGPVTKIARHECHSILNLIAMIDTNSVWIYEATSHYGIESKCALKLVGKHEIPSNILSLRWLPTSKYQFLSILSETTIYLLGAKPGNDEAITFDLGAKSIKDMTILPTNSEYEFLVLGGDGLLGKIHAWTLSLLGTPHLLYKQTLSVPPYEKLVDLDYFHLENAATMRCLLFATVQQSRLQCWRYPSIDGNVMDAQNLLEAYSLELVETETGKIKYAGSSKMAHLSNKRAPSRLSIWNNADTGLEPCPDSYIQIEEEILDFDWFLSASGDYLIVVATCSQLIIYTRSTAGQWLAVSKTNLPSTKVDGLVTWLPGGEIIFAECTETIILNPWKHLYQSLTDGFGDHILSMASNQRGELPEYDPAILLEYSLCNRGDLVRYNLSLLYRLLRISVEHELSISNIPVALWRYFDSSKSKSGKVAYEDLFANLEEENTLELGHFSQMQSEYIKQHLAHTDFTKAKELVAFITAFEDMEGFKDAIDRNGQRYLLSALYSLNLAYSGRLPSIDYVWAQYSESQDTLLDIILKKFNGKIKWEEAKGMGIGWWVQKNDPLKMVFETIARNQYWGKDGSNDPVNCALYYLALKKKSVLIGLWKMATGHPEHAKMLSFLGQNFQEEKPKTAASKNAFALLGKQRFENAAAFFLLADMLKDCAVVCLKYLKDPQLAVCICRIYEGDNGPILNELVNLELLDYATKESDQWMKILLWGQVKSFDAVLKSLIGIQDNNEQKVSNNNYVDPRSYYLYSYLLEHQTKLGLKLQFQPRKFEELQYHFTCAKNYDNLGFPVTALLLLKHHGIQDLDFVVAEVTKPLILDSAKANNSTADTASGFDWGESTSAEQKSDLDWGEMGKMTFKDTSEVGSADDYDGELSSVISSSHNPGAIVLDSTAEVQQLQTITCQIKFYVQGLIMRILKVLFI